MTLLKPNIFHETFAFKTFAKFFKTNFPYTSNIITVRWTGTEAFYSRKILLRQSYRIANKNIFFARQKLSISYHRYHQRRESESGEKSFVKIASDSQRDFSHRTSERRKMFFSPRLYFHYFRLPCYCLFIRSTKTSFGDCTSRKLVVRAHVLGTCCERQKEVKVKTT